MKMRLGLATLAALSAVSVAQATAASDEPAAVESDAPAAAASVAPPAPFATVIKTVKIKTSGTKAKVTARYACPTGEDWHLWVSVKQAADGSQDAAITQEGAGSGHAAAAWLQDHPTKYTCDGKTHTWNYTVTNAEPGYGTVKRGSVWVQFCLISEAANLSLIDQRWADAV